MYWMLSLNWQHHDQGNFPLRIMIWTCYTSWWIRNERRQGFNLDIWHIHRKHHVLADAFNLVITFPVDVLVVSIWSKRFPLKALPSVSHFLSLSLSFICSTTAAMLSSTFLCFFFISPALNFVGKTTHLMPLCCSLRAFSAHQKDVTFHMQHSHSVCGLGHTDL